MSEKKIGGNEYSIRPMPAKRAIVLFAKVSKVLGPALPKLIEAMGLSGSESENESNAAAISALNEMLVNIEPESFADLIEEIIELAQIMEPNKSYRDVIFDQDFTGNLSDSIPVMAFVLREQFGDFFTGLLATGKAVKTV